MGEFPLLKSKLGLKLFSSVSAVGIRGLSTNGFLDCNATFRLYGRHHGLDNHTLRQRHLMVLRLARRQRH